MSHVGQHPRFTHRIHQGQQTLNPEVISRQLRLQIRQQLIGVAGRPGPLGQPLPPGLLQQPAAPHQRDVVEQQSLLRYRTTTGWHGSRRDPSHIGVVAAGGDEGHGLITA